MIGESTGVLCRKPLQKSTSRKGAESNVVCQGASHTFSGRCSWDPYLRLHAWFDASKQIIADFRHRVLRHHAEGIFMAETLFGTTITLSTGRVVPMRWIGEQHGREDLGFIPSFADWVKAIRPEPWMGRAQKRTPDALP